MARKNGSTNTAPVSAEQATEMQATAPEAPQEMAPDDASGAAEMPPTAQPGEQEPHGEPGPEDFARHTGARLVADHEQDLHALDALEKRLGKRAHEIAVRTRKKGANAIVAIGGRTFQPRAKPGTSGETMILAEVKERFSASLD